MKEHTSEEIARMFQDGRVIDEAFAAAYRRTVLRHRQAGVPLVVWRSGEVVEVPAESVELEADASVPIV